MYKEIDLSRRSPARRNPASSSTKAKPKKAAKRAARKATKGKRPKRAKAVVATAETTAKSKETTMAKAKSRTRKASKKTTKSTRRKTNPTGTTQSTKKPTGQRGKSRRGKKTTPVAVRTVGVKTSRAVAAGFKARGTKSITATKYKSGKFGYNIRSNPTFTLKHAVAAGVGGILGLAGAELLDRWVATRATSQTANKVAYGQNAASMIRSKSDGTRIFAQAAACGALGFGAYLARKRSPMLTYGLAGASVAFGFKGITLVMCDHVLPAVFASKKCGDVSSRLFSDRQDEKAPACAGKYDAQGNLSRPFRSGPASAASGMTGRPCSPAVRLSPCSESVLTELGTCRKNGQMVPSAEGRSVKPTPMPTVDHQVPRIPEPGVPDTSEVEISTPDAEVMLPSGPLPSAVTSPIQRRGSGRVSQNQIVDAARTMRVGRFARAAYNPLLNRRPVK